MLLQSLCLSTRISVSISDKQLLSGTSLSLFRLCSDDLCVCGSICILSMRTISKEHQYELKIRPFPCVFSPPWNGNFRTYGVFTAPVKQRPAWGLYHAGEHRAIMKDFVNFVSFTAAPLLPLPQHKQIKCAYVIHLLCYQTVPLLGSALRPTRSHRAARLLLAVVGNSGNISTPQGYLLQKLRKWRREMEHWREPSLSGYGRAKRLVKCIYFLVGGGSTDQGVEL